MNAHRTIGCFVNFSADWLAPGRIIYGGRGALVLGEWLAIGWLTPAMDRLFADSASALQWTLFTDG